jgi:hypothetical protein
MLMAISTSSSQRTAGLISGVPRRSAGEKGFSGFLTGNGEVLRPLYAAIDRRTSDRRKTGDARAGSPVSTSPDLLLGLLGLLALLALLAGHVDLLSWFWPPVPQAARDCASTPATGPDPH